MGRNLLSLRTAYLPEVWNAQSLSSRNLFRPEKSEQYTLLSKASLHLEWFCVHKALLFFQYSSCGGFKTLHSRHWCLSDLEVQSSQASDAEVLISSGAEKPSSRNSSTYRVWQVNKVPAEQFPWIDAFFHPLYPIKFAFKTCLSRNFLASSHKKEKRVELNINVPSFAYFLWCLLLRNECFASCFSCFAEFIPFINCSGYWYKKQASQTLWMKLPYRLWTVAVIWGVLKQGSVLPAEKVCCVPPKEDCFYQSNLEFRVQ